MKEFIPNTINWEQKCWRYFKTDRFIDALENGYMYFAAANEFEDKFEGATFITCNDDISLINKVPFMSYVNNAFKELQRLTKISCWHKSDHESDLMWKVYAQDKKGVAITTTPEIMRVAFQPYRIQPEYDSEDLYIGNVKYVDLSSTRIEDTMLGVFYYKHKLFEAENELRLSISLTMAEEFGVIIPTKGILVSVDYSILIEDIIIGPNTSNEDYNRILEELKKLKYRTNIKKSCLTYTPVFI